MITCPFFCSKPVSFKNDTNSCFNDMAFSIKNVPVTISSTNISFVNTLAANGKDWPSSLANYCNVLIARMGALKTPYLAVLSW